jgi:uncharacterized protein
MKRYLENKLYPDLKEKIVFLSGPRQVGKTFLSKSLNLTQAYLNFDSGQDRKIIMNEEWARNVELVIFDELHKMKNWKSWVKGIYDTEGLPPSILVTGSARLETYKKSGDSLAGRYFSYRLHPLSVKEVCLYLGMEADTAIQLILLTGGFPEPFLKGTAAYAKRWRKSHLNTMIREDLLDLEKIRDIKSIELLIDLLRTRVGATVSYSSLARDLQVSGPTIKHWISVLESLFVIFRITPFHKNIARSILKEAKYYFYDTGAVIGDTGAKLENLAACAFLKELHFIEDTTGSRIALHYLRDKEKREVDFLLLVDDNPVFLVEAKVGDDSFSPPLFRYHNYFPSAEAVQIVLNLRKPKEKNRVKMEAAAGFLRDFTLSTTPAV